MNAVKFRPLSGAEIMRLLRSYTFAFALLAAILLLIANLIVEPSFNLTQQLAAFAPFALVGMATTPSIISGRGGIDISISPLMTFVNIGIVAWLLKNGITSPVVVIAAALGIGAAVGGMNGVLVAGFRFQPIVATLCTYFILGGVNLKLAPNPELAPENWTEHLAGSVGPIPGGLLAIGAPLVLWLLLDRIPYRRLLYVVGGNDAAAYSSGVNVTVVRIAAYAFGGLIAGIAGLSLTGLVGSAEAASSYSYTLPALAAVALGGTSLAGGRGGLFGAALGAATIFLAQSLLKSLEVSATWVQVVYGLMLLGGLILGAALLSSRKPVGS
jgi:ribose transport system permease protein